MPASEAPADRLTTDDRPRAKKPFKPAGKSGLIADRKGRRVLVQRTGSEEARAPATRPRPAATARRAARSAATTASAI